MRLTVCLILAVPFLTSCAGSEPASFDSREPSARLAAAFDAVESRDRAAADELIVMLASDDPAERLVAIRSLQRLTGETFGYDHAAPDDERQAAIDRWNAWAGNTSPVSPNKASR